MTTLLLASSLSPLLLNEFILEYTITAGDCIVICLTPEVNQAIKQAGLPGQLITTAIPESWAERDKGFADLCMDGVFGDNTYPDTTLKLSKVLSMDRLSFWHNNKNANILYNLIVLLKWKKIIVPLDIYHSLPLTLGVRNAVAVETVPIRTREVYDIASLLPFDIIIQIYKT